MILLLARGVGMGASESGMVAASNGMLPLVGAGT